MNASLTYFTALQAAACAGEHACAIALAKAWGRTRQCGGWGAAHLAMPAFGHKLLGKCVQVPVTGAGRCGVAPVRVGGMVGVRPSRVERPLHSALHLRQPVRLRVVEEQREFSVVHLQPTEACNPGEALHMHALVTGVALAQTLASPEPWKAASIQQIRTAVGQNTRLTNNTQWERWP